MKREHFVRVVEETLDSLSQEFRTRVQNFAVLVEDLPPNQPSSQPGKQRRLLLGIFTWRAHHEEKRIRLAERTRSYRPLPKEY
jgi:predicted Zn-dependent protease with MMP-like domain